jgi:hypothetical protein
MRGKNMGKHAIIIIKNEQNDYLQYFDEIWNSYLFVNYKLEENFNEEKIIENISNEFKINKEEIECTYIAEKTHKKFSESAKKEKEYQHYFYSIHIKNMPNIMKQKSFTLNNKKYEWYSLNALECDERIQKVNGDIVGFVKELDIL